MSALLPFVVVGLVSGSVYGLAAMGLVLTYKTTGVFNFAHGAVATAAAYLFFELRVRQGIPWPVAAPLAVVLVAGVGGPLMEVVSRSLVRVPVATRIVATIGLLLGIQGVVVAVFGAPAMAFPDFLPTRRLHFPGVYVGVDQIIVVAVSVALAVALFVFFRRARLGLSMQAVVDNPDLLGLNATSPVRVRTASWVIGLAFAALSGVLLAPSIGLNAPLLTLLVVRAFGAGAIGGFSNLPLTFAGGLAIGVAESVTQKYASSLVGFNLALPFIVLFVVLLVAPRLMAQRGTQPRPLGHGGPPASAVVRRLGPLVAVGVALLVPAVVGTRLPVYTNAAIYVVLFVSLALLVRTSGQVSLCHAAFAAVGAATFSHLAHDAGLPWLLALVLAGLVTVPVGAVVAIPAIRLSGLYLALATFGFGVLLEQLLYRNDVMFGRQGPRPVPRPVLGFLDARGDTGFYYVVVAIAVVACCLLAVVQHARLGRLLRAMSDSPLALRAQGVNVNTTRVMVFCLSAFLAGIAGGLFGALSGYIDGSPFGSFQSLLYLAVLAIAGAGEIRAAVVAAVLIAVVPAYLANSDVIATYEPVAFGVGALAVAIVDANRQQIQGAVRRAREHANARRLNGPVADRLLARRLPDRVEAR